QIQKEGCTCQSVGPAQWRRVVADRAAHGDPGNSGAAGPRHVLWVLSATRAAPKRRRALSLAEPEQRSLVILELREKSAIEEVFLWLDQLSVCSSCCVRRPMPLRKPTETAPTFHQTSLLWSRRFGSARSRLLRS